MTARVEIRRDAGRIGPASGPWLRRNQIARFLGTPDPHDIVAVIDRHGEVIGHGLISTVSTITVRMLSFGPVPPPTDWLEQRISGAFAARERYDFVGAGTDGYRLVNSEGDGLPGLVIDRYGEHLVVQITTAPMAAREDLIHAELRKRWSGPIHVVVPDTAARHEGMPGAVKVDGDTELLEFSEYGLHFAVPAPPSQKTGAYFDQRANRRSIAALARAHGGAMLDVGCHVGGFALHARRAGVEVVALDRSRTVLELGRRNAERNELSGITWVEADMFAPLQAPELDRSFGTIVFDPPKLAARRSDADRALGAMAHALRALVERLDQGGHLVVCSCSHHIGREQLDRLAAEAPRALTRVRALGAGADHPIWPCHKEGEYLRVNVYQRR